MVLSFQRPRRDLRRACLSWIPLAARFYISLPVPASYPPEPESGCWTPSGQSRRLVSKSVPRLQVSRSPACNSSSFVFAKREESADRDGMQGGAGQAWCANHCLPGLDAISSAPPFLDQVLAIWLRRQGSWPKWLSPPSIDKQRQARKRGKYNLVWVKYLTATQTGSDAFPPFHSMLDFYSSIYSVVEGISPRKCEKRLHLRAFCALVVRDFRLAMLPLWRGRERVPGPLSAAEHEAP